MLPTLSGISILNHVLRRKRETKALDPFPFAYLSCVFKEIEINNSRSFLLSEE